MKNPLQKPTVLLSIRNEKFVISLSLLLITTPVFYHSLHVWKYNNIRIKRERDGDGVSFVDIRDRDGG